MAGQRGNRRLGGSKIHPRRSTGNVAQSTHGGKSKGNTGTHGKFENKKRKRDDQRVGQEPKVDSSHLQPSKKAKTNKPTNAEKPAPGISQTLPTASFNLEHCNNALPTDSTSISSPPTLNLSATHSLTTATITTSSHIRKRVTLTLETLSAYPHVPPERPRIMVLQAKAMGASKLITVVEISKRGIAKTGGKWFQYNAVEGLKEERIVGKGQMREEKKGARDGEGVIEEGEDELDEDEGFESMKTPFERAIEGTAKIRAIPVMTVYLSRIRIESLKKLYGEQTNALI